MTNRVVYFDWLRIFATFAVVVIHCCSKDALEVNSFQWSTINLYSSLVQWAVPVFVMISGALFLDRKYSLRELFNKHILRIGTVFIFWSVLYACWRYFVTHEKNTIREFIISIIKGNYHMWFLFMIVGLYLIVPFLKKIVEDRKIAIYFVILSFLFAFLFPQCIQILGIKLVGPSALLSEFISKLRLELVLGYSGYFVLGYLLNSAKITKRWCAIIYFLGLASAVFTVVSSSWASQNQIQTDIFLDELSVNILIFSVAVFVFAKQNLNKSLKHKKSAYLLSYVSKCTFGIYLVHPLIIDCLKRFGSLTNLSFEPIFSVPVISVIVFVISLGISAIFNKIPFVKKWFV